MGLLATTPGSAKDTLGVERIAAQADMGYCKGENIESCEANGITPYVRPTPAWQRGRQRPLPQGEFLLRSGSRGLSLPWWPASRYPLPLGDAWPCVDPVFQPFRLRRLRD